MQSWFYVSGVAKSAFIGFRITVELKSRIEEIAAHEERSMSQVCEMLLRAGVEGYERKGPTVLQSIARGGRVGKKAKPEQPK